MEPLKKLDESQFKADFEITDRYINFSSELLRLSLLAIGAFATLVFYKLKQESPPVDQTELLSSLKMFFLPVLFFALTAGAALIHRFYATDCTSYYVCWLRYENEGRKEEAQRERKKLRAHLKYSEAALIAAEFFFAAAVLIFVVDIYLLLF